MLTFRFKPTLFSKPFQPYFSFFLKLDSTQQHSISPPSLSATWASSPPTSSSPP